MLNTQLQQDLAQYARGIRGQLRITQYPVYMETLITRHFTEQMRLVPSLKLRPDTVRAASKAQMRVLYTNPCDKTFEQQRILNYKLARQMAQYLLECFIQDTGAVINDTKQAENILLRHIMMPEQAERLADMFPARMLSTLFCLPAREIHPLLAIS